MSVGPTRLRSHLLQKILGLAAKVSGVVRRWTGLASPVEENCLLACGSNVKRVETTKRRRKTSWEVYHFVLYSEQERVIPIVKHFLEKPEKGIPLATAETGYLPGETR